MASIIVAFVIGILVGGMIGFFGASLMSAGPSADEHIRALRGE